jgi:hypothetical protein
MTNDPTVQKLINVLFRRTTLPGTMRHVATVNDAAQKREALSQIIAAVVWRASDCIALHALLVPARMKLLETWGQA